nr:reverse transcriptase domain-containing protein [Tanacetum cinerariifolium]
MISIYSLSPILEYSCRNDQDPSFELLIWIPATCPLQMLSLCFSIKGFRLILPNSCVRWLSVCILCRPMRKEGCATWDRGKSTWGGRARGFGTVPVCVSVQEKAGGMSFGGKILVDLQEHTIAEKDFKNLYPSDFEDLNLLLLQGYLDHLLGSDKLMLSTVVKLWTQNLVIRQQVEDFQLGIKSYQTRLNLTKPGWDATGYEFKHDYTINESPRVVVFPVNKNERKIMRVKEFKIKRLNLAMNTRFWTKKDVTRSKEFIAAIERNYHQLLPIIAEKVHQEKVQQEKLKSAKAHLNFEEDSQQYESGTLSRRRDLKKRLGSGQVYSMTESPEPRCGRFESSRKKDSKRRTMFKRLEKGVFHRLGDKEKRKHSLLLKNVITKEHHYGGWNRCQEVKIVQEDTESQNPSGRSRALRTICPNRGTGSPSSQKTPKEILALDKGKFKPPSPMTTPIEKRNTSKFCEFHREVGHTTDECMHLKRKIKEMLKGGNLSHLIKELKQNNRKDQTKRAAKQRITQNFSSKSVISFLPLGEDDGTEGPMIIKAEMEGHFVHRMYMDGGSSSEILQKKRGQAHEKNKAIYEEVEKLVDAGIMKEVHYHSWQSNPVMVKNHDGSWRMCVDFKDLNKACPKDGYLLPEIDLKDGKQMPIYFVSRALQGLEINYTPMEKLILALMLSNSEVTGRLLKWRFELEEHDIQYRLRTSVKGQIITDFIVERSKDDSSDTPMKDKEELPDPWILFTDGLLCVDGSRAGLIITNPKVIEFTYALRFRFDATNNEAENEALIAGLWISEQIGVKNLQENVDSRLDQILREVQNLTSTFKVFSIKQVPRGENKKADTLSKMASTSFAHLRKQVLVEELKEKSLDEKEVLAIVEEEGRTWMTPIYEYLTKEILPEEKRKARAIRRKAGRYAVRNEILYKRSLGKGIKAVGRKNKKLAGKNITCIMGTSYYDQIKQWRNVIFADVWNGSGDPSRDWHANLENRGSGHDKKTMSLWKST